MKATKITSENTNLVDLGIKKIFKYPIPTRLMSISHMVVKGRHPEKGLILENDCAFAMYVLKGEGKYFVSGEVVDVKEGDVLYVPAGNTFACEGNFEYITVDVPAFYQEQQEVFEK